MKSQMEQTVDYIQKMEELYSRAMWLLGSLSNQAHEWAHDCELDYETREYKRAEYVLHDIHNQASELYSLMFDFKWSNKQSED